MLQEDVVLLHSKEEYCRGLNYSSDHPMKLLGEDMKSQDSAIDRFDAGESLQDIQTSIEEIKAELRMTAEQA